MGNRHPTCPFCHSSTVEGYICYILRAIFLYEVLRASRRDSSAVHCPALPYIVGRWVPGGPFPLA
jgi:hypothetical protein